MDTISNISDSTSNLLKTDGASTVIYSLAAIIITVVLFIMLFKVPKDCYTLPPESTDLACTSICGTNNTKYRTETILTDGTKVVKYEEGTLKDFYIKSAYNCCSTGSYKNCNVSLDMLKYVIRQGVRLLDFAIYSIDGQPIVATSSLDNNMKTTYNYLYFSDILEIIRGYAFSSAYCPNPNDPIFIHLRIYSTSNTMIKNLGDLMQKYTSMFLNTKYSFDNQHDIEHNFGNVYLKDLQGKVVLFVQKNTLCYDDRCPLYEYINMITESDIFYALRYYDVENTRDMEYLINHNKQFMTIVFPDIGDNPPNPGSNSTNVPVSNTYGCQFTCMRYQTNDEYLKDYNAIFNNKGYAFVLKPEDLRYKQPILTPPIPQKPGNSYAPRNITGSVKGTSFTI